MFSLHYSQLLNSLSFCQPLRMKLSTSRSNRKLKDNLLRKLFANLLILKQKVLFL